MKKIPPSERISKEIKDILHNGTPEDEDLLSTLVKKSVKKLLQEVIEQEVQDYLGRCFEEQKRRTKVIPRFLDESGCLKLIYATLIRVSEKWQRIKMSEYDIDMS